VDRGLSGVMLVAQPVVAGLAVAGLALVRDPLGWLALWAVIGVAQAGMLYETCFSHLTRVMGGQARAAITRVTLVAGLASTVSFPLGHWLGEALGGRGALVAGCSGGQGLPPGPGRRRRRARWRGPSAGPPSGRSRAPSGRCG
jgi:hypothetical protein